MSVTIPPVPWSKTISLPALEHSDIPNYAKKNNNLFCYRRDFFGFVTRQSKRPFLTYFIAKPQLFSPDFLTQLIN